MDGRKKRYNVKRMKISGESGDMRGETVDSWKEGIPELLQGYSNEKIWNLNGTACSWRALPDHGFSKRGSQYKRWQKGKTA